MESERLNEIKERAEKYIRGDHTSVRASYSIADDVLVLCAELADRDAEIATLRILVKDAYDEGWEDRDARVSREVLWDTSTTKAALDKPAC